MKLRWITRDGKQVLQQEINREVNYPDVWQDVPVEKEKPKEPEYFICCIDVDMDGPKQNWHLRFSNDDPLEKGRHRFRLVDERLVEKLVRYVELYARFAQNPDAISLIEEYRRHVPKK